jgi:hypothetical protein
MARTYQGVHMKKLFLMMFTISMLGAVACGDDDDDGGKSVCEKAVDIAKDCGDTEQGGNGGGSCEGTTKAAAQCIVDHPDCEPDADESQAILKCLSDAAMAGQ